MLSILLYRSTERVESEIHISNTSKNSIILFTCWITRDNMRCFSFSSCNGTYTQTWVYWKLISVYYIIIKIILK